MYRIVANHSLAQARWPSSGAFSHGGRMCFCTDPAYGRARCAPCRCSETPPLTVRSPLASGAAVLPLAVLRSCLHFSTDLRHLNRCVARTLTVKAYCAQRQFLRNDLAAMVCTRRLPKAGCAAPVVGRLCGAAHGAIISLLPWRRASCAESGAQTTRSQYLSGTERSWERRRCTCS